MDASRSDIDSSVDTPTPADVEERGNSRGVPSNDVYDRVGDDIKIAAHQGVRRGMNPQDIIRDISAEFGVHLNVGELRMLLAARRVKP